MVLSKWPLAAIVTLLALLGPLGQGYGYYEVGNQKILDPLQGRSAAPKSDVDAGTSYSSQKPAGAAHTVHSAGANLSGAYAYEDYFSVAALLPLGMAFTSGTNDMAFDLGDIDLDLMGRLFKVDQRLWAAFLSLAVHTIFPLSELTADEDYRRRWRVEPELRFAGATAKNFCLYTSQGFPIYIDEIDNPNNQPAQNGVHVTASWQSMVGTGYLIGGVFGIQLEVETEMPFDAPAAEFQMTISPGVKYVINSSSVVELFASIAVTTTTVEQQGWVSPGAGYQYNF